MTFRTRLARIGYVLGTALVVAAIVFFFASHWGGLARELKTVLAACLTAGLYALSFVPARLVIWRRHGDLLPLVFLFAGTVSFGATAALLDNIYNILGEPWRIMAVWLVPALLFALLLRNVWFYALAYVIGHLALNFWFFSPLTPGQYTDWEQAGIFALFGVVNLFLFVAAETGRWQAGFLKRVALAVFLFIAVFLSNGFILGDVGRWLNLSAIAVLAVCFYAFGRRRDSFALSLTALAASFYAVLKFLELMEDHYSEWFFLFGLVFVAALLTGNVLFFRYVARLGGGDGESGHGGHADAKPETGHDPQTGQSGQAQHRQTRPSPTGAPAGGTTAARVVSTIVTVVGTAIGTISLIGLFSLVGANWNKPELVMLVASCLLVLVIILIPRLNATVRNTGVLIGLLAGNAAAVMHDAGWAVLLVLAIGAAGWIRLQGYAARLFVHVVLNVSVGILCLQHFDWYGNDFAWTLVLLAALNGLAYGLHRYAAPGFGRPLKNAGLVLLLVMLFWLTFLNDVFPGSHALFNLIYFALVTSLLVLSVRRRHNRVTALLMAFWFIYAGFKYYDWLWDLMHKSMTLLVGGLILLSASAWLDRRSGGEDGGWQGASPRELLPYRHLTIILLIIALQLVYIGGEAMARERMLADGTTVKLSLEPMRDVYVGRDNRAYLHFAISELPEHAGARLRNEGKRGGERIAIVLRQGAGGAYRYERLHVPGEPVAADEVVINGRFDGWQGVRYGMESMYVGEGEAHLLNGMRYALVRIGTNGNPLLLELSPD